MRERVLCPHHAIASAVVFLTVALTAPAVGQTGPELLRGPSGPEQPRLELSGGVRVQDEASVDANDEDLRLTDYASEGRYRFGEKDPLTVGYETALLDLQGDGGLLPDRLLDMSVAGGGEIGSWGDWNIAVTVGAGFAGDTPFSDSDAWYAKANLLGRRSLGKDTTLGVALNFDGNRTIFPDVPLPLVYYTKQVDKTLRYTLGAPVSSVRWRPGKRWLLRARYTPAFTVNGSVRYSLTKACSLFAAFRSGYRAFHEDGRDEHTRLFFHQRRVEAGPRWAFGRGHILVAGGYAFDQSFERGFDVRDTDEVTDLSDEPYIRAALELRF